jgi:GGDEF domain-containing protein
MRLETMLTKNNNQNGDDPRFVRLSDALIVSQHRLDQALVRVIDIANKHPCSVSLIAIKVLESSAHDKHFDKVLTRIGKAISGQLRNIDLIGYGPGHPEHDFMVVTAPAFHVEGKQVAVRLCQSIRTLTIDDVPQLNLACGVSAYRSGDTPNSLLTRAKRALTKVSLKNKRYIASDGANESDLML